jgi:hypothetical protein
MIKTEREKNAHVVIDEIFTEIEKVVQIVERHLGIFLYCSVYSTKPSMPSVLKYITDWFA